MDVLEKTIRIVHTMTNDTKDGTFIYWEEFLESFKDDDDYLIMKSKMNNLIKLANSLSKEELVIFADRDFETDIWFEI